MSYALFLGCVIPAREPSYELAVRKIFKALDVNLVDLEGANCCAPAPVESLSHETSLALSAYNICLAEEKDLNIISICNGCFETLSKTNELLKKDQHMQARVNEILASTGKQFKGSINVKDYLQVLNTDIGLERLKRIVTRPLNNLRVASFGGCHLLKPSKVLKFDDPEVPVVLDDLIEATGAKAVQYLQKTKCCGGLLRGVNDDIARQLAREKLYNISYAKADCAVTVCPFCFISLDVGQLDVKRKFNETYNLPVFHYAELLGLAMGLKPEELGLNTHRVPTASAIQKLS